MRSADSLLCVGLDPDMSRLPAAHGATSRPLVTFCCEIADSTAACSSAFKLNSAFFEQHGASGWSDLRAVMEYLRQAFPDHFLICDSKRGDIGNTNRGYVQSVFDELGADAITLHPYLGAEALEPFLAREDKASIILCRTSNPGAGELQDLDVNGTPLWQRVAERVSRSWNARGNCMLVVGATWPDQMRTVRATAPELSFLVPGIGAQGGDVDATMRAGLRADGFGLLLSSSRDILYAPDPAKAAQTTRDAIREARRSAHA